MYKRRERCLKILGRTDLAEYRCYLEIHRAEWAPLDALCRNSISRFYRDRAVFLFLEPDVLPELARRVAVHREKLIRCWSIGYASGEESYTLGILWKLRLAPQFPGVGLRILGGDADPLAIARAQKGCYPISSVRDLPEDLLAEAFCRGDEGFCIREGYGGPATFQEQDIRLAAPDGLFHLILCRNLAFTYFADELQHATLRRITAGLVAGGALVIGSRGALPREVSGFEPWSQSLGLYRRSAEP